MKNNKIILQYKIIYHKKESILFYDKQYYENTIFYNYINNELIKINPINLEILEHKNSDYIVFLNEDLIIIQFKTLIGNYSDKNILKLIEDENFILNRDFKFILDYKLFEEVNNKGFYETFQYLFLKKENDIYSEYNDNINNYIKKYENIENFNIVQVSLEKILITEENYKDFKYSNIISERGNRIFSWRIGDRIEEYKNTYCYLVNFLENIYSHHDNYDFDFNDDIFNKKLMKKVNIEENNIIYLTIGYKEVYTYDYYGEGDCYVDYSKILNF